MTTEATVAGKLAAWATGLKAEDIPGDVLETAHRSLADTLAVILAGSHASVVCRLANSLDIDLSSLSEKGATVVGQGLKARPARASTA